MRRKVTKPLYRRLAMVLAVATVLLLVAGSLVAFTPCRSIKLAGLEVLEVDEVLKLAHVDTTMNLFSIEPGVIEARVLQHPWVRSADVMRIPTGTLRIRVSEREPVLLAIDRKGRPYRYLDSSGYALPVRPGEAIDVPLIRGVRFPEDGSRQVEQESVRSLLPAVAGAADEEQALLSEFEVDRKGEVWLRTSPTTDRGSQRVRLGRTGFDEKFDRLEAFWRQILLPQPEKSFQQIDLRFDSQIVTNEIENNEQDRKNGSPADTVDTL